MKWLENVSAPDPSDSFWAHGLSKAPRPVQLEYSMFCKRPKLAEKIFELKTQFDGVPVVTFRTVRR